MVLGSNTSGHLFDTTFTTNGVAYSAASGVLSNTIAGTTGQILMGNTGSAPTFQSGGTSVGQTITGDTGGALSPTSGNWNLLGTGSITSVGSGSTLTTQLTGLTNHALLVGAGNATITKVGPTATAGQYLQSAGSSADPVFSTATLPSTATGTGKILRADGTNWVATTATYPDTAGTSGNVLTSDGTNWTSAVPATSGTVTSVSGTANQVAVANGTTTPVISLIGPYTPATYTAHGVLVGEGTSSIVALATGSTGQVLQSGGASADPAYSTATYPSIATGTGTILRADGTNWIATTATYPATTTVSQVLYSSATNVVSGLATANNGTLVTSNTGVPSILAGPGTTGNILQSNAAAAPSFSTTTYPSTNAINTLLYASSANVMAVITAANNGTLITSATGVPSWLANGTTGQLLTATTGSPPSWVAPAAASGLVTITGTVTNAQLKAISTPVVLLAAQGAGTVSIVVSFTLKFNYGGTNAFTLGNELILEYSVTGRDIIASAISQAEMQGTVSLYALNNFTATRSNITDYENTGIQIRATANFTGNAANNNTVTWSMTYKVISI